MTTLALNRGALGQILLRRFGMVAAALSFLALSLSAQIARVANSTLTLPQAPQTFGYSIENAFVGLTFSQPVGIVTAPGETDRLFVLEKTGRIQMVSGLSSTPVKSVFLDLSARVLTSSEEGLLGLAFHPNFAANHYFYVFYSTTATTGAGTGAHERIARFTALPAATNAAILATEVPLISQYDEADNHNGGDLHFGPDGYLYISLGDEGGANDQFNNSQRIDRDFFAGLLRIDVDQRAGNLVPNTHPAVHAGTYKIPADNPFVGATSFNGSAVVAANVHTEFWAVGLRNPWRFSFDDPTGRLFVGDVGQGAREEIDLVTRGGNYGWNYREGTIAGPKSNPPAGAAFINPIWEADRSTASSITGGVVYRGTRFSQLYGTYVFGDYGQNRIFAMTFPASGPVQVQQIATESSPVGFGADPRNGDILIANIGSGLIRRLVYNTIPTGTPLPATLTATGAFSDLATLTPAAGVVAYDPNVSFWSDYAKKRRWFSVPALNEKITFAADGSWTFPAGTVWVKHFELELTRGDPTTARRLETRLLVKTASGVYGVTYKWNPAQTEATLVAEAGENESITINDGGTIRSQLWRYPSRSECLQCHTPVGGYALSFNTAQLNRSYSYASGSANQLTALASAGYFTASIPAVSTLRALAPATDTSSTVEHRVRSYLAANCVQCHQPGGAARGNWDARIETPTATAGLLDGVLVDSRGDTANRVVAPGDPAHSMMLTRISTRGAGQMPPLGSNELDATNMALLSLWITPPSGAPAITSQPLSSAVFSGGAVTMAAVVSGTPAPTYQWQKNGIAIPGATNASLSLNNVQVGDAGSYALVATNSAGSVTSRFARLVVLVPQANAVTYQTVSSPTGVSVGGTVGFDYLLTNIGTRNWGANHYLSVRTSSGIFVAFTPLVGVNAGESKIAHVTFSAPATPGIYGYTVQALESGVEFFSTQADVSLTVLAQQSNAATYNATNFPVSATPGSNLIFNYNVTNTGTKNWGANHFLALRNSAGVNFLFSSLNGVAPGQSKTVNLSLTAPSTPGVYPYYVQAMENGVEFFIAQANLVLTVLAPQPNAAVYTAIRSIDNVTPGATINLRYSLSNAGTGTWGGGHYVSLRDGNGAYLSFVALRGVAPTGSTTANFSIVAPTTPGIYPYYVQALEDGVEFFGTQDVAAVAVLATPLTNAIAHNATTFPLSVARGATVNFAASVTNRGTKTWDANYYLSLRDADNAFLGFPTLSDVTPGGSRTVNFSFVAPSTAGIYTYRVQALESGVQFFNMTDTLVLQVQ